MLKKGEKEYYYLYNSQNDVIGLIDSDGKQVVNYSYDAWGKQTGLTDTSGENIGKLNPFRYRAYCYDDDTKLYVTASRYYDPELCRFLCADNFDVVKAEMFSMNGKNLYVYCCNNPVNAVDDDGDFGILMLALSGIDPQKVAWDIVKGVFVYAVQCGMANEKVTLEGLAEVAIESAIGSVLGGGRGILFSIAINGVKGIYAEYQESGNGARALGEVVQGAFEEVVRHKEIFFHIFLFDAVSGFTRQNHQLADNVFSTQVDARVGFGVTFLLRHFDSTAERNVGANLIEDII